MSHAPHGLVAIALGLALATPAQAQQTPVAMASSTDGAAGAAAAADALRNEAAALLGSLRHMDRIIELRLEAARVAPLEDPLRADDLQLAGVLSSHMGRLQAAGRYLEEAAATALAFGNLPQAAQSLMMASAAAATSGDVGRSKDLVARAELLAHSPLMPAEFCDCLDKWVALQNQELATFASRIRD